MWQPPPPPRHSLAAETVFLRNLLSFKTLELQFFWSKVLRNNSLFAWEMGRGGDTVCWRVGSGVLYNQVWMRWRCWTMHHQMLGNIGHNLLAHFKHLWSWAEYANTKHKQTFRIRAIWQNTKLVCLFYCLLFSFHLLHKQQDHICINFSCLLFQIIFPWSSLAHPFSVHLFLRSSSRVLL